MKTLSLFAVVVIAFAAISCKEENNPVYTLPDGGTAFVYEFGASDQDGNFTGATKEYKLVYGEDSMIENTLFRECQWIDNNAKLFKFALSANSAERLIYSYSYYPFIDTSDGGCFTTFPKTILPLYRGDSWSYTDSISGDKYFSRKYDGQGNEEIVQATTRWYKEISGKTISNKTFQILSDRVNAIGYEIKLKRIFKLIEPFSAQLNRMDGPHPEFYSDNDRTVLSDDITFKIYTDNSYGIVAVIANHKTPISDRMYCFKLKKIHNGV